MQLIGASLGRTGTMSTRRALNQLGLPCFHMVDMFENLDRVGLLEQAAAGEPDFDALLAGFVSTVDYPMAMFWRELSEAYPDARVLLSTRDADAWYDSTLATLYPSSRDGGPPPPATDDRGRLMHVVYRLVWQGLFEGRFTDRAHAIRCYHRYQDEVRDTIAPDRLLPWSVADGWEPLCRFLEVPVPDAEFPRSNSRAQFNARLRDV